MLRESHRLLVNQAMPHLLAQYNQYSFQVGLNQLNRWRASKCKRKMRQAFTKMRGKPGRTSAILKLMKQIE